MSNCNNCSKCYQQADDSIVKRGEREGAYIYTLPDLTVTATMPATFISTTEVDCSKFDSATQPPKTIAVLEEVDADGKQTGVLVQAVENPDGTVTYKNLSDGSAYVAPAGSTLHTSEDTDYNENTVILCDEGTDVIRTVIYRDGDIADVVSTTITKLDGSAHTLSGNERSGSCSGLVKTDQENACFVEVDASGVAVADKPKVGGYVRYSTNAAVNPAVTTSQYFGADDVELTKAATGVAGFKRVECC